METKRFSAFALQNEDGALNHHRVVLLVQSSRNEGGAPNHHHVALPVRALPSASAPLFVVEEQSDLGEPQAPQTLQANRHPRPAPR